MSTNSHLPDFIIIGAQRGGTTSLWGYLRSHPDVFMPDYKEPNFFLDGVNWFHGIDWYKSLFDGSRPGQLLGEASTGYTNFPAYGRAPERIAALIPNVRLIYLIREPISRMKSAWILMRSDYHEWRPLRQAVVTEMHYLAQCMYSLQLSQYLEYFDRRSILVLRYEDLASKTFETMTTVCEFLGIDPAKLGRLDIAYNSSNSKMLPHRRMRTLEQGLSYAHLSSVAHRLRSRPINGLTHLAAGDADVSLDPDTCSRLMAFLQPDLDRLRKLLGPSMDLWGLA